jgi:nicotinamide mononucleotide transporter
MIASFFDINNVFFTLWDYPLSYLEFFGTVFNILCVWLTTRKSIWNWPVGIVAVILFGVLFYQIRLYSDFLEQIYYFATGIWGWVAWSRVRESSDKGSEQATDVKYATARQWVIAGAILLFGTLALGGFMARIDVIFPQWFPEAASFPYLDAFTTVAAFVAQVLLILKVVENWYLWILLDVIGVWLYYEKEVKFVSVLYFIFLILATKGLLTWKKECQSFEKNGAVLSLRESGREEVPVI